MKKEHPIPKLERTYCRADGLVADKYKLLCALAGIPISKSCIDGKGEVLYVRNGILCCGMPWIVNSNNGFRYVGINNSEWLNGAIKSFCI